MTDHTGPEGAFTEHDGERYSPEMRLTKKGKPDRRYRLGKRQGKNSVYSARQRLLILDAWTRSGLSATDFASICQVPASTLYEWRRRFMEDGPAGLENKPRGPGRGSKLDSVTRRAILMLKGQNPDWIALDMLSQAEHDESAQAILITDDAGLARDVATAIEARLETLERRAIAGASWRDFGAIITVPDLATAAALSNRIAPEHLELCVTDPDALSRQITHAGAIFLGAWTPEAIGDYVGGPNHVLPTARSARFSSGLSVLDFLKRTTLAKMTPEALRAIGPAAETLARAESLEAHGLSVRARLDQLNG